MPANVHLPRGRITLDPNDPLYVTPSPIPEHARILDVGCGPGQTLIAASKDRRAYGVDVSFEALTLGRTLTGRVTFICGVAEALPFRDCSFDFVIARVSLPYTNIGRSVREIHRVLKPEGKSGRCLRECPFPSGPAFGGSETKRPNTGLKRGVGRFVFSGGVTLESYRMRIKCVGLPNSERRYSQRPLWFEREFFGSAKNLSGFSNR
jgi:SAM-dependent methyltransferase